MAKIDYTAAELAESIAQTFYNKYDIGMKRVNWWYVEEGSIGKIASNVMQMVGIHSEGKISCEINNAPAGEQSEQYCSVVLNKNGSAESISTIKPGEYKLSYTIEGLPSGASSVLFADVYTTEGDYERYYAYDNQPREFVVPDNVDQLVLFARVKTEYPQSAVSGTVNIFPFLRLKTYTSEFEPFRDDLQTQILNSGGGNPYNESISSTYSENVQEV